MYSLFLLVRLLSLAVPVIAAPTPRAGNQTEDPEDTASKRLAVLEAEYHANLLNTTTSRQQGCHTDNIRWRQEWTTLPPTSQKSFITALHCLNSPTHPSTIPPPRAPGARTRYDDFVATHIEQTPVAHASGLFLPFHRYFVHLFEQDLRNLCGYTGPMPYWDWTLSWRDPGGHVVFDGGEESLGGNGAVIPHFDQDGRKMRKGTEIRLPGGVVVTVPPATGGGCVERGPFARGRYEVRLGPVGYEPRGPDGGLGYNPRCLTRDLSPEMGRLTAPSRVLGIVEGCKELGCVNERFDFQPDGTPGGVHAAGHWQVGLNALDVYASPSDPVFWLHHAQVDRVWAMWQGLRPGERTGMVWGTETAANDPPSDNVTLDTMVDFGILSPPKTIRELVSTIDGDLCYGYR